MALKPRPHYATFDFYAAKVEALDPFTQLPLRFHGNCEVMAREPRWWSVRVHVLLVGSVEATVFKELELVYTNNVKMLIGRMGEIINDDLNERVAGWWHVVKGTATCSIIT